MWTIAPASRAGQGTPARRRDGARAGPRAALGVARLLAASGPRPPDRTFAVWAVPAAVAAVEAHGPPAPRALARRLEEAIHRLVELPARFAAVVEAAFPGEGETHERIYAAGEGEADREEAEWAMVEAFRAEFSRCHFPLADLAEDFHSIGAAIPFEPGGFEWDDLEELDYLRDGFHALIALLDPEAPAAAARAAMLQEGRGVPTGTLALLPREPVPWETLEARFGDGPHAAVLDMGRWLNGATGTVFLDTTTEDAWHHWWDWTAESVRELTAQWAAAREIAGRVHALAEWLEGDLPARLHELLLILDAATLAVVPEEVPPPPGATADDAAGD